MDIVRNLDEQIWADFVEQHPDGNIFQTPDMFQVFARARGHKPELWAAVDEQRQVRALLVPVQVVLANGPLRRFTARSIAYGGVLCSPQAGWQEALTKLWSTYIQQRQAVLFTELRHKADSSALQPILQGHRCQFEEEDNFLVDLALPVEQVWLNIKKSARKKIRQAENKEALVIEEVRRPDQIAAWYQTLRKTYETARVPLADRSLFEAAFDVLYPKGRVQFLLGQVEGKYVAASVALLYKGTIYGWYRGFDRDYGTFLPNDLMVWHLLKWGAENGYRLFDFGGAGKPNEEYGPRQFKAKFGGNLVSYGRNVYVHNPKVLRVSRFGYQVYRRFFISSHIASE